MTNLINIPTRHIFTTATKMKKFERKILKTRFKNENELTYPLRAFCLLEVPRLGEDNAGATKNEE
jgi:hypothetical protein